MISKNLILVALCAIFSIALVMADCPNQCSGHGTCGENNKCLCYPGWNLGDCSRKTCPANAANEECSGRGECDAKTGNCKCDAGYEGEACQRSSCPNACSGHGSCEGPEDARYCKCDGGFSGADCTYRLCPKGDDPLTTETYAGSGKEQQDEIQTVTITLSSSGYKIDGDFVITFEDAYGGSWTTRPITAGDASATLEEKTVEDILESLPNQVLPDVTVDLATKSDSVNEYTVTFVSAANSGDVNPLVCKTDGCNLDGCQPRYAGILKKKSRTFAGATDFTLSFFGDNTASQDITVDTGSNGVTATSSTILTFASSAVTKTKTPVAGATVTIGSVTTTLASVSLDGKVFTFDSAHGVSDMSSGNLVISFTNRANTVALMGTAASDMAQAVGQTAASAAQSIEIVVAGGKSKLTVGGTTTTGIDLTQHIHVGDILSSTDAFVDAGDASADLLVVSVTALEVELTKGGAVLTAKAAVTSGNLNLITIKKTVSPLSDSAAGDSIEFSGTGSNNKEFTISSVSSTARSAVLNGVVVTEGAPSGAYGGVIRKKPAPSEITCVVAETKKGTKEAEECSTRGICDGSSGICECFPGYTGEACDTQTNMM